LAGKDLSGPMARGKDRRLPGGTAPRRIEATARRRERSAPCPVAAEIRLLRS